MPPLLLAQFKPYHSLDETLEIIQTLISEQASSRLRFHFSVPYSFLAPIRQKLANPDLSIGAETLLNVDSGSFPSTVAGKMIKDAGATFVLIGDVEERQVLNPSGVTLKNKILHAIEVGITPIFCFGETLEEFHEGQSKEVLQNQLSEALGQLSGEELRGLHLLYDAPWINRTPFEAASDELQKAYHIVKDVILELFVEDIANQFKVIYAVPTYSPELPDLMRALPAAGYSLGVITSGAAEMKHLIPPLGYCEVQQGLVPAAEAKKMEVVTPNPTLELSVNEEQTQEAPPEKKPRAPRKKKDTLEEVKEEDLELGNGQ